MPTLTFDELAAHVQAEWVNLPGGNTGSLPSLTGIQTLDRAGPGQISFVLRKKFLDDARRSRATAFIVAEGLNIEGKPCLPLKQPWKAILFCLHRFHPAPPPEAFRHPSAIVSPSAKIGRDVWIGPLAVIDDEAEIGDRCRIEAYSMVGRRSRLGADCHLHPRVTILHDCRLGDRVIVQTGALIGGDGFKYEVIDGRREKIPQVGGVVIEDDVEIGAGTTIDRASYADTRIGAGTKIDNLVQIAHNVQIGKNCLIVSQAGIAGSTRIGDGCIIGPQAGLPDNLTVGDHAIVGPQAGPTKDIPDGAAVIGSPAVDRLLFWRVTAATHNLPEMVKVVNEMKKQLGIGGEKAGR
ncbi:MAG: UDP-3-O-(3-hydroxymyristoyl)glucosamine N-acyltransferase [Candidatus Sumerlaeia bacterium]